VLVSITKVASTTGFEHLFNNRLTLFPFKLTQYITMWYKWTLYNVCASLLQIVSPCQQLNQGYSGMPQPNTASRSLHRNNALWSRVVKNIVYGNANLRVHASVA